MVTKGYGLTAEDIDNSCPTDLKPYEKACVLEQKQKDAQMWLWWGNYGLDAIRVAVERCFAGQKAKAEYPKKPLLSEDTLNESNTNKESNEEVAVYEMKQRINLLRQSGLPESPD